jgi:hypothetical protein
LDAEMIGGCIAQLWAGVGEAHSRCMEIDPDIACMRFERDLND